MTIPISFYFQFWCKGTLLALGTGTLLAFLVPPLIAISPYFISIAVIVYQISVYKYFWGNRRGDFEYKYKETVLKRRLSKFIFNTFGFISYVRFQLDNLIQIRSFQPKILNVILKRTNDLEIVFITYLKLGEVYSTQEDFANERIAIENSIKLKDIDLVANIKIAICSERLGDGERAIIGYSKALEDPLLNSDQLKLFITQQIRRVKTSGPNKRPPMPGLRYMSW